jgi:hypothetical protein
MKIHRTFANTLMVVAALLLFAVPGYGKDEKMSVDVIVAKHLDSIGTQQARDAVKSRYAEGTVAFNEVITGKVHMEGTAQLVSQGRKTRAAFKFGQPQYPGEQFVFDGQNSQVAMTDPGQRSLLGNFMYSQTEILNEGLLGGTLFTSWPLFNLKERGAKLKFEGTKKINDKELLEVTYIPKKRGGNGELLIRLYFDPETYRHVLTLYTLTIHAMGGSIASGTDETKEYVEERFDNFKTVDGVTLPMHWDIRYRKEPSKPQELQWDVKVTGFAHNTIG